MYIYIYVSIYIMYLYIYIWPIYIYIYKSSHCCCKASNFGVQFISSMVVAWWSSQNWNPSNGDLNPDGLMFIQHWPWPILTYSTGCWQVTVHSYLAEAATHTACWILVLLRQGICRKWKHFRLGVCCRASNSPTSAPRRDPKPFKKHWYRLI